MIHFCRKGILRPQPPRQHEPEPEGFFSCVFSPDRLKDVNKFFLLRTCCLSLSALSPAACVSRSESTGIPKTPCNNWP